jgi:hypothetical protein
VWSVQKVNFVLKHVPFEMVCLNFDVNRHYQMHNQRTLCTFSTQQQFDVHSGVVIVPDIDSHIRNTFFS